MSQGINTSGDRYQAWYHARRRAWEAFAPRLSTVQSLDEARQLLAEAPPAGSPGQALYANLAVFLQALDVPPDASDEERSLYEEIIQRLQASGTLEPGALQAAERRSRATDGR